MPRGNSMRRRTWTSDISFSRVASSDLARRRFDWTSSISAAADNRSWSSCSALTKDRTSSQSETKIEGSRLGSRRRTELELGSLHILLSRLESGRLLCDELLLTDDRRLHTSQKIQQRDASSVISSSGEYEKMTGVSQGRRTLISFSLESLLFLKSSISFSSRLTSAFAWFCLSLDWVMTSLSLRMLALSASTSAMICDQKRLCPSNLEPGSWK
jgi:hypothetical protein